MGKFIDDIRQTVDALHDGITQTLDDVEKTEKVLDYWSEDNSQNRTRNERLIRYYKRKSDIIAVNSLIMWVCMIIVTIACWFCFDLIVGWLHIDHTVPAFFAVLGIDAVINLIIAGVLHLFRH